MHRALAVTVLIALAVLLALGTGKASQAGQPYTFVVDNVTPQGCMQPQKNLDTTISEALGEDLQDGDTIYVCPGNYLEPTLLLQGAANVSLVGPGVTGSGGANITIDGTGNGFDGDMLEIQSNAAGATVTGLNFDATPPNGYSGPGTEAIGSFANGNTITNNNVSNSTFGSGIGLAPVAGSLTGELVQGNHLTSATDGIFCVCDDSMFKDNVVTSTSTSHSSGINVYGNNLTISGNTVNSGTIALIGNSGTITNNTVDGNGEEHYPVRVEGSSITVTDNEIFDAIAPLDVQDQANPSSVTLLRNHFHDLDTAIELNDSDSGDANTITATIGSSSPADANVFRTSGGALGDGLYLLSLRNTTANITAENNDWGLCSDADIAQEVQDHADDASLGTDDYDPFVAGPSCPTPTPSPTPFHTPTPTHSATPTPTGSPAPSPTVTPAGQSTWGDVDCDGTLRARDALVLLYKIVGFTPAVTPPCPEIGTTVNISIAAGAPHKWGDLDCDADVDVDDVLAALRGIAGTPLLDLPDGCPVVGGGTIVIGG